MKTTEDLISQLAAEIRPDVFMLTKETCPVGTKWTNVKNEQVRARAIVRDVLIAAELNGYRLFDPGMYITEEMSASFWKIKPLFPTLNVHSEFRNKFFKRARNSASVKRLLARTKYRPQKF